MMSVNVIVQEKEIKLVLGEKRFVKIFTKERRVSKSCSKETVVRW